MENLEFEIMLTNNYYTKPNSMHICFPMEIKKATDKNSNTETDLITVNKFLCHLIKEINVTKHGNDNPLMPTFSPYEIYQYSDAMLKNLPKSFQKHLKNDAL